MRPLWKDVIVSFCLGVLLPSIGLQLFGAQESKAKEEPAYFSTIASENAKMEVLLQTTESCQISMDMESYLTGVILGEMPSTFQEEALKAQAVAARTYTYKKMYQGEKHGYNCLCTDPSCCQAYLSAEEYFIRGGTQEGLEKVHRAVRDTADSVLIYNGELIEAVYFSNSGGMTESALAVWGTDYPYLQSVNSPGEESAKHYMDSVVMTETDFQTLIGKKLNGTVMDWFGSVTYTEGGGVASMEIAGEIYEGTTLRSLLNLRSTAFTIMPMGDQVVITTRGNGHRVGLSQYGANAMAARGNSYEQILSHYYPGTSLVSWNPYNNSGASSEYQ